MIFNHLDSTSYDVLDKRKIKGEATPPNLGAEKGEACA
jgi:hypothetical protein